MKEYIKFISIIFAITILNICNLHFFRIHFYALNENQILYVFSILAQVVAALMGLIIATYSLLENKKELEREDDAYDLYAAIRKKQYRALKKVTGTGTVTIILSILSITLYDNQNKIIFDFVSNEAMLLFVVVVFYVIVFVFQLDPEGIKKEGKYAIGLINIGYSGSGKISKVSCGDFIIMYKRLENLLIRFALDIDSSKAIGSVIERYTFREALMVLVEYKIIDHNARDLIDNIRIYRNALVHSMEQDNNISCNIGSILNELYYILSGLYEKYQRINKELDSLYNTKEYKEFIAYADKNQLTENEKKIVRAIYNGDRTVMSEYKTMKRQLHDRAQRLKKYAEFIIKMQEEKDVTE